MDRHGSAGTRPEPALDEGAPRAAAVLVCDDEPVVRSALARTFARAGIAAQAVGSGREALRLVADGSFRPTVLLTDIEMPEMSGVELAARLTALRPGLRVVMMTGDPSRAEAARQHPGLAETCLLKPITTAELLDAIEGPKP